MKKSAIITLALSASLLSACSNTSASSSKTKQVLNWFSAGEISTMEGLVRLGNNSKILPGIAKSWKESKDGMTWTFNLRKNAKWSNGEALAARPPT
ncbi:ABC transporter substrate-binding protein [Lactobacillus delbrueckii]|uniref:ABC transporter substrate-binding protein n=1 Tax=Lactobacillus delbrueckii TaxID=1584 RepID=A0AAW5YTH3_9LACO|nr:ABC transporter substrate-binding protein [Lactobacillus delbrueckii]MDA3767421.1 ABC transporter substrate-binding protein [Lactobacillus delbrueckii]